MAETILFSLAEGVLKNLGSKAFNEIASAWVFKTQLKKLKNTVNTLKDVLLDVEELQADNRWLERLSTVVYAADDLFDEFNAVAARNELMGELKLAEKVRIFFSNSNQVVFACKISQNIKKIREELDDIVKDGKQFEFLHLSPERGSAMSRRMKDQSISYVDADEVVGREDNKKDILEMLLESSSSGHDEGLPVIPIVGMGGMGKTTLAQLIYNDPQVKEHFDLRLWVCVSDVFDIKAIIDKLLKSATNKETPNLEMDQLQGLLQKEVAGKKYLLVLDDVWNEERQEWLDLRNLLKIGRKGSKILATTRSRKVAKIMGTSPRYDLQGLSEEKSWKLFEKTAFSNPEEAQQKPHLVKIGKEIIKKCGHVPLAIRTLGSLLYGEEERKWLSVRDTSLVKIRVNQNENQSGIMNILRLSYDHLWSPLKNCFAYCALFPKDYQFKKEMLIDLWIAEGFIVPPSHDDQSVDEAAEDYFHTLLQRGFLQDIERNSLEVIESCKMHDLMHDLAQEVAGVKCKIAKSNERSFDERSVHLSLAFQVTSTWEIPNSMLNMKLLRTFLLPEQIRNGSPCNNSISPELPIMRFRSLRVLDLNELGLKSLPSSLGKLIHLRYLNLSRTPIENLPNSTTDLHNLQTLRLDWCKEFETLPADMWKLINLRSLNVVGCAELKHMPSGLGGLTSLNSLPHFKVAPDLRYKSPAKLSDLKNLNNLKGFLEISIWYRYEHTKSEAREADLSKKHGITALTISFPKISDCNHDEAVLEGLKPHANLRSLHIHNYKGQILPSWARVDNFCTALRNLVEITLGKWQMCQQLPAFSQLLLLKRLTLGCVKSVEYIESDICGVPSSSTPSRSPIFFPSLEWLDLSMMDNLKGWWKEVRASEYENETSTNASNELAAQNIPETFMQFSKLSILSICGCPELRLMPLCPNVEDLSLENTNDTLSVSKVARTSTSSSSSAPSLTSIATGTGLKLKKLRTDNTQDLMSIPNHCLPQLSFLSINGDNKLESTDTLGDFFSATLSSSLRSLKFCYCQNLRSIAKGMEHLTTLESLEFYMCDKLDASGDEEGMPWKALNISLRSLELHSLPQLVGLPRGLQHLANLRSLNLSWNYQLEELPEWIGCFSSLESMKLDNCKILTSLPQAFRKLTSLKHLEIIDCPKLTRRCQGPNGSDWHKIQHIPFCSVLGSSE